MKEFKRNRKRRRRGAYENAFVFTAVIVGTFLTVMLALTASYSADGRSRSTDTQTSNERASGTNTVDTDVPASDDASDTDIKSAERDPAADENAWMLILVNPWNRIPDDFSVTLSDLPNGQRCDSRVKDDLTAMMDDMRREGLSPLICSSYRTNDKQRSLYENEVRQYTDDGYSRADAELAASMWVAVPGTSEHQTGLAFDIVDESYQVLDEGQESTPVQLWLMKNSYKYGFILRYPNSKSAVTGINYEPWHYRYVGVKTARAIFESGLCFEEYLDSVCGGGGKWSIT